MARKKSLENSITLEYSGEPAEAIPIPNAPVEEPIVIAAEEIKAEPPTVSLPVPEIDIESELAIAHKQIEHCTDYTVIPGADYKGYYRGKLKEWQMYAYKLRQYKIHGGNRPVSPEPVEEKY